MSNDQQGFARGAYGQLSDLHRQIREKFTYITDQQKHGMVERWEDSSTLLNIGRSGVTRFTGDCEEFALVAADGARRYGYNVRLVVCYVETGEGHCLCEVASEDFTEAFYLDNRQIKLSTRDDLKKYKFVAVSPWNPEPRDERPWMKVAQK
ncbi:hypothetical protein LUCX_126 [Xanthomonas phage vB_XciM_LucasX]|nr:hypothetical protein LUCX_126 [Xanthomonas phage vB_XciM_LucasX]